jgi:hypothetical protein
MVLVPVSLDYLRGLAPDRVAVFDYSDDLIPLVRGAGFGLVIVANNDTKKIVAVGRKGDLAAKARAWKLPYTPHLDFQPLSAATPGGWFARRPLLSEVKPLLVK